MIDAIDQIGTCASSMLCVPWPFVAGLSLTLLSVHAICLAVLILGGAIFTHHIKGGKLFAKRGATKRAATGRRIQSAGADFSTPQPRTGRQIVAWRRKPQVRIPSHHRACLLGTPYSAAREAGGRIVPGSGGFRSTAAVRATPIVSPRSRVGDTARNSSFHAEQKPKTRLDTAKRH